MLSFGSRRTAPACEANATITAQAVDTTTGSNHAALSRGMFIQHWKTPEDPQGARLVLLGERDGRRGVRLCELHPEVAGTGKARE